MAEWVRALESFAGASNEPGYATAQVDIVKDKIYRTDHLAYAGREHLFEALEEDPRPSAPTKATTGRGRATSKAE